jgi:hypothetical protein
MQALSRDRTHQSGGSAMDDTQETSPDSYLERH